MKNSLRILLVIFALLFMQSNVLTGNDQAINEIPIKPDSRIQAQINHIILIADEEELSREISKLKEMESLQLLLQQLFYFQLDKIRMSQRKEITGDDTMMALMGANGISCRLLGITDEDDLPITYASAESAIDAVLPYLETKDPHFREILHTELAKVELVGVHESDYSKYESYIENKKLNPPEPLIKYMYEKSPGEALLSLMNVYMEDFGERQGIIQAEQVIRKDIERRSHGPVEGRPKVAPQAKEALDNLSKYEHWWIHLYVAEILYRQPEFRTPQILERLKKDKHPLVSEAVSRF